MSAWSNMSATWAASILTGNPLNNLYYWISIVSLRGSIRVPTLVREILRSVGVECAGQSGMRSDAACFAWQGPRRPLPSGY